MEIKLIDELVKDIENSDESTRLYAIEDLCEINDIKISAVLINRLQNEKSQIVRENIIDALKKIIPPEMYSEIYKMFASDDAFIRNAATTIFAGTGDLAVDNLEQLFSGSNNEIKKLILDSLFGIGTPLARKAIRSGLTEQNMNVLISSIEYLGLLHDVESSNRFIEMLTDATQPMLTTALLRSIAKTCDLNQITETLDIVQPGSNYKELNNLYLSEILNLVGEGGYLEDIIKILKSDINYIIYSEEISSLLLAGSKRYNEILSYGIVKKIIMNILNDDSINDNTLLNISIC
jgi:HEAT repeat protein